MRAVLNRFGLARPAFTKELDAADLFAAPGHVDAIARLRAAIEVKASGALVGESGIGKSELVARFVGGAAVAAASAVVLAGRCYERESVPYKAFDAVVDALTRYLRRLPRVDAAGLMPRDIHELARVFPVLERVPAVAEVPRRAFAVPDRQEVQRRAFRGLKELLGRISDRCPLVLHIGDLQWGDEDSARLLTELLSPPDPPAMLLLTTYRDQPSADASLVMLRTLAELRDQCQPGARPERRAVELGPLALEDAERLASSRLEQLRPTSITDEEALREQARVIARESEGSPLFVEELVRHATRGRAALVRPPQDSPELSLEQVVRERLAQLEPAARRLLHVLAVASRPLPGPVALVAAELGPSQRGVVDSLRARHLARVHGARPEISLECYHDRIRETVLAQLDADTLRDCHRALAHALERAPQPDLGTIAQHLYGAGEIQRAARHALAAAERAVAAVAFNRAAQLYELAARWDPRDPDHARALRVKQAHALAHAGRCADAAPLFEEMALEAPADEAVELRRAAAEQFLVSGHIDDGVRILRPLLAEVGLEYPKTPDHANAAIIRATTQLSLRGIKYRARERDDCRVEDLQRVDVCWSAGKGLGFVDPIRGYSFYLRSLLLALQLGTPGRIARSLASVGMVMMSRGTEHSIARGTSFIGEAERIAQRRDDPYLLGFTDVIAGTASLTLGRWRDALERIDKGVQRLQDRCVGVSWERGVAQMASLRALLMMGELDALAARASAWERQSDRTGDVNGAVWAGLFRALPLLARDRPAELRQGVRAALARWSRDGFHFQHLLALVMLAYCDIYEGQPRAAHERFETSWGEVEDSRILSWQFLRIFGLQARASAAIAAARSTASSRQVERLLASALRYAHDLELGGAQRHDQTAAVSLIRAGVASCRRQHAAALSHLDAAAQDFDAADMRLHAACARRRRGQLIGGEPGQQLVDAADMFMARLGVRRPERWANIYAPGFAFLTTPRVRV
ncbi:MAG: AAA family ATPase [Myxococcales bacterium]|nr:AAA family ATPase [Myxococcales bacterium]